MRNSELNEIEARAADWIAERDRCDGQLHPVRQAELDTWLAAATAHRVAWLRLDQAWQRAERLRALQPAAPLLPPAPPPPRRRSMPSGPDGERRGAGGLGGLGGGDGAADFGGRGGRTSGSGWAGLRAGAGAWLGARSGLQRGAAGLGLATLALVVGLQLTPSDSPMDHRTERGQRELVTLADGTRLTLNTATQLRSAVTPQARQVWLERGEAFFDVAHDAKRPFVIHAGHQTVTVLGTKFSLYREGDKLRVAVLEGRVQVQGDQVSRPTVLTRDHAALADAGSVLVTQQTPQQLQASLGWLQGKLVFNEVSLAEAARQFNRYGHKQLVIQDDAAARIAIGGVFDASNVDAFARLLHAGFGLEVKVVGEEIRVGSAAGA